MSYFRQMMWGQIIWYDDSSFSSSTEKFAHNQNEVTTWILCIKAPSKWNELNQLCFDVKLVKMIGRILFFVTILLAFASISKGHPTGAGLEACMSLNPAHGDSSHQTTPVPVQIKLGDTTNVQPNQLYKIKLHSDTDTSFKGFLVQARRTDIADAKESGE